MGWAFFIMFTLLQSEGNFKKTKVLGTSVYHCAFIMPYADPQLHRHKEYARVQRWYAANPQRQWEKSRRYYAKNKDAIAQKKVEYYKRNKTRLKKKRMERYEKQKQKAAQKAVHNT